MLITIFLLVIVFYIINNLMQPYKKKANFGNIDKIENTSDNEPDDDPDDDPDNDTENKSEINIKSKQNINDDELAKQVLDESENNMGTSKNNILPKESTFNYKANDEDKSAGADFDIAFDKPIPNGVKTDVIDLNRNNVKNYNAKDYLPKEINDDWFNTDFSQAKYNINDDKLINTEKYIIGINTVGQSLKNASYDIRGSINVPKFSVSPWNNSTTEADYNIKPLC